MRQGFAHAEALPLRPALLLDSLRPPNYLSFNYGKADNPDSIEVYFNQSIKAFHAVSEAPLAEVKVSSIALRVDELEAWERQWLDIHLANLS